MNWTNDRVELLKKLWMEGLSASQIAAELGEVTRNGVIGKIHRLKLGGRAKTGSVSETQRQAGRSGRSRTKRHTPKMAEVPSSKKEEHDQEETGHTSEEIFIPANERVALLELKDSVCKWPIGDPLLPDFHFCGKWSGKSPYCEFHARRAYH